VVANFRDDLDDLTGAIRDRDAARVLKIFQDAKAARDAFAG
jgi:prephenate dehydrogenase